MDRWLQHYEVEPPFGFFSAVIDDLKKLIAPLLRDQREEIAKAIENHRVSLVGPEYYGGLTDAADFVREGHW